MTNEITKAQVKEEEEESIFHKPYKTITGRAYPTAEDIAKYQKYNEWLREDVFDYTSYIRDYLEAQGYPSGGFWENGVHYFGYRADGYRESEGYIWYDYWSVEEEPGLNIFEPCLDTSDHVYKYGRDVEAVIADKF